MPPPASCRTRTTRSAAGDKWHINSAYSVGGPQCSVRAIQDLTGLKIDRVIGIDFAGFQNMVDALGGVTVNVCGPIIDGELGIVIGEGGVQTIQGNTALSLVRARKVEGDTDSDLARIRRQQIVLSAILQQVTSAGTLLNPAKLDAFLQAFVSNTFTDNVTIDDLVTLAQSFGTLDPSRVTFFTLPTVPSVYDSEALDPDETKAPAVFSALLNDQPLPGEPAATTTAAARDPGTDASTADRQRADRPHRRPERDRSGHGEPDRPHRRRHRDDGPAQRHRLRRQPRTICWRRRVRSRTPSRWNTTPPTLRRPSPWRRRYRTRPWCPSPGSAPQVRLLLGSSYDGTVESVQVGTAVTGTLAEGTTGALPSGSAVPR